MLVLIGWIVNGIIYPVKAAKLLAIRVEDNAVSAFLWRIKLVAKNGVTGAEIKNENEVIFLIDDHFIGRIHVQVDCIGRG